MCVCATESLCVQRWFSQHCQSTNTSITKKKKIAVWALYSAILSASRRGAMALIRITWAATSRGAQLQHCSCLGFFSGWWQGHLYSRYQPEHTWPAPPAEGYQHTSSQRKNKPKAAWESQSSLSPDWWFLKSSRGRALGTEVRDFCWLHTQLWGLHSPCKTQWV